MRGTAAAKAPLAMPKNAATSRVYSGVNVLILWGAVIEHGFPTQSWLTFRQALSLGGHVRKGETGSMVVYASRFTRTETDAKGEEVERGIPFLKAYTVFCADQIDDLPAQYYGNPAPVADPVAQPPQIDRAGCAGASEVQSATGQ